MRSFYRPYKSDVILKLQFFLGYFILLFLLMGLSAWKPVLFKEDHVFEWIQVLMLFGAAIVTGLNVQYCGNRLKPSYYLWMVIFFFLALEEISFGQRIFSFATPEWMKQINTQGEVNIHNIGMEHLFPTVLGFLCLFRVLLPLKKNSALNIIFSLGGALDRNRAFDLMIMMIIILVLMNHGTIWEGDEVYETIIYPYLFYISYRNFRKNSEVKSLQNND